MKIKQILLLSIGLLSPLALAACEPPADDMPPGPDEEEGMPDQPDEPGDPGDDNGL
ncbi:hypothetical protein [Euhalothece natronophila]|uniref:hypothetical protein n=1 Tax=Euhalothece natronophila TaxID=577489 RepID=UPI001646817D|nr:hypothetical protein [Euhalothece natronophila]